ncbi:hypothetical protein B4110_1472 [Parageobacillus toebii]|uniref:Uncharacterized protein n=1 Tax=Parageobacillus toebii TaxID=153151 RepID=A0A150N1U3_9BACL|nr:hypothetical protein B4110_1472 [Parageobacillus toebii]
MESWLFLCMCLLWEQKDFSARRKWMDMYLVVYGGSVS